MSIGAGTHAKILVQIKILTREGYIGQKHFVHDKTKFAKPLKEG